MKLYQLQKGDRFIAKFYDQKTDILIMTICGEFISIDGMYGVVALDGIKEHQFFSIDLEVEKDNK